MTTSATTTVRVRCNGALHTITLTEGGALSLNNHPGRGEADKALIALGGKPCRCLDVLQAWRQRDRAKLPQDLRPALDAARTCRLGRCRGSAADPLEIPFLARAQARVTAAAKAALTSCTYRRSRSRWAGGDHICSAYMGYPKITGYSDRVWSENDKWSGTNSCVTAFIPLSWYSRVYRRGLAVVEGVFVLDVLSSDGTGFTVLAGKQGRGFAVAPAMASVTPTDGGYRLCWAKKEVK